MTLVEDGEYLRRCLRYVDLNMVRTGVAEHPEQWLWCGYGELMGKRQRIVAMERLLASLGGMEEADFQQWYGREIDRWVVEGAALREPAWTESLAVGSGPFVEGVRGQY